MYKSFCGCKFSFLLVYYSGLSQEKETIHSNLNRTTLIEKFNKIIKKQVIVNRRLLLED